MTTIINLQNDVIKNHNSLIELKQKVLNIFNGKQPKIYLSTKDFMIQSTLYNLNTRKVQDKFNEITDFLSLNRETQKLAKKNRALLCYTNNPFVNTKIYGWLSSTQIKKLVDDGYSVIAMNSFDTFRPGLFYCNIK